MGLRIATNIQSIRAQNSLNKVVNKQSKSLGRLSSGSRINKASDDAAGLAISEKLKANLKGTDQAKRNASDGISMIQTAEGGMNEVSNILIRLRELSVQSASDTVGDKERQFTDLEFQQLVKEVGRISQSTEFNGTKLLNGETESMDFQIGIQNDPNNDRISFTPSQSSIKPSDIGIEGLGVASKDSSQSNLQVLDDALDKVNGNRAILGALQNRLESTINNLEVSTENLSAANSRIRDTDIASESAELAKSNILSQAGTSVLSQSNTSMNSALRLIG